MYFSLLAVLKRISYLRDGNASSTFNTSRLWNGNGGFKIPGGCSGEERNRTGCFVPVLKKVSVFAEVTDDISWISRFFFTRELLFVFS